MRVSTEQQRPFAGRSNDAVRAQRDPLGCTIKRPHKKKRPRGNVRGRKDNKGENARINSQRTWGQYSKQLQPASLVRGAPASPFWKAAL